MERKPTRRGRLDQLQPEDFDHLYGRMAEGTPDRKGVGPRTIRLTHTILRAALKRAVRWRKLQRNPSDGVELPKQERREMKALGPAEAEKFLQASRAHPLGLLFRFLLVTGMRPGEALALRWQEVDFKAGCVRVVRALELRKSGEVRWAFVSPKAMSERTIPIPATLVSELREHRLRPDPGELGLVFAEESGLPLDHRSAVRKGFKSILAAADLDGALRVYDLRHSCATLLMDAKTPAKAVSERLGHSKISMTLVPAFRRPLADRGPGSPRFQSNLGGFGAKI